MKEYIYKLVSKDLQEVKANKVFNIGIMCLILLSVVEIILESVSEINTVYGDDLKYFNRFSIIVFTIEYIMRLYVSDLTHPSTNRIKSAFKFIFSTYGIIDLLAILPFYLPMLIKVDLRFLRVLRLIRFVRILKLTRYNNSVSLIWKVLKEKRSELSITGFVALLILLISSFLMYYIEGSIQPEAFPNVLASMWWAVATLTTVGYGDIYPVTALGKVISGLIALLGIGVVALPTGIIGAGFMDKIGKQEHDSETIVEPCKTNTTHSSTLFDSNLLVANPLGHLKRVKILLDKKDNSLLLYIALELRLCIERAIHNQLSLSVDHTKSHKKGNDPKKKKLLMNRRNPNSNSDYDIYYIDPQSKDRIFWGTYKNISESKVKKIEGRLGNLLHMKVGLKLGIEDDPWYEETREFLQQSFEYLNERLVDSQYFFVYEDVDNFELVERETVKL